MVRSSKCPQVTVFGDVQVFDAETGEIRDGDAGGIECDRRFAVLADLDRAVCLVRRVLQLTKLLTLTARIHQQERGAAQDLRVEFLLAGGIGADGGDVGAGLKVGGGQQREARRGGGDDEARRTGDGGG